MNTFRFSCSFRSYQNVVGKDPEIYIIGAVDGKSRAQRHQFVAFGKQLMLGRG